MNQIKDISILWQHMYSSILKFIDFLKEKPDENQILSFESYQPPVNGEWHDHLYHCFSNIWPSCICVSFGCNSYGYSIIYLIGQIANRINFIKTKFLLEIYFILLLILSIINLMLYQNSMNLYIILMIPYLFIFIFLILLRYKFVSFFNIQESSLDTFLISFLCSPCSLCQMARHLYGYSKVLDGDATIDGLQDYSIGNRVSILDYGSNGNDKV